MTDHGRGEVLSQSSNQALLPEKECPSLIHVVNNNNTSDQQRAPVIPLTCSRQSCTCVDPSTCVDALRKTSRSSSPPRIRPLSTKTELKDLEPVFGFKVPGQHYYDGIIMGCLSPPDRLNQLRDFQVKEGDIIVSGYPKSGTTWLEEIVYLIQHEGDTSLSNKTPIYLRVPYLEGHHDGAMLDSMATPRVYKTHFPHRLLPNSVHKSNTKIVHIVRNPRDTAVSYFHFHRALTELGNYNGTWKQFLDMFCQGYVCYGDWFTHTKEWWSRRHDPNVMLVTYESMRSHPHVVIAAIAHFCGKELDADTIDRIAEHTSFENMKNNPMLNFDGVPNIDTSVSTFMRKGQVGDWKNYFTVSQNEAFQNLLQNRLGDITDLPYSAQCC